MSVSIGAAVSTELDPFTAASAAASRAREQISGEVDLAVVFAAGAHLAVPEATLEGVHLALAPGALIGCGAGGVLGERRELESGTAVAVWAACLDGGEAVSFHARVTGPEEAATLEGLPQPVSDGSVLLLSDPYSFPTEPVLASLTEAAPAVPVLGGLASARTTEGAGALFADDRVCDEGAVGVLLSGVEMIPCVSQGAKPLGRELTITAAEGNIIQELAGRPALEAVETVIAELDLADRALVAAGLLLGVVIDSGQPEYLQGDFLVRGVLGADPSNGALAVAATVEVGQIVRLHARDGASADADLRRELRLRSEAIGGRPAAGALLFSCNGRGRSMFGSTDHDATMVATELGHAPVAGFFAAGEIGPVGGRSFLHGFTATVAVFPG